MTDNTLLNAGAGGDTIATDDIGGVKHQRVKVQHGADGAATDASTTSPFPVRQVSPGTPLVRFLDLVGDGTGAKTMAADYSTVADQFWLIPGSGEEMVIDSLTFVVRDGGTWSGDNFAGLGAALTNGIGVAKWDDTVEIDDLLDNEVIQRTADFDQFFGDIQLVQYATAGDYVLRARMDFGPLFPMVLEGPNNHRLRVHVNDNLSTVTEVYAIARGYVV